MSIRVESIGGGMDQQPARAVIMRRNENTYGRNWPGKELVALQTFIDERVHRYYWQDELDCAVTTLKVLGELYEVEASQPVLDAAFGLNAGRCGWQCGLVEGALLFIGLYGKAKGAGQEEIRTLCRGYCAAFEARFGSLLCKELRPEGFGSENPPHLCERRTKEAVLFSAAFIASIPVAAEKLTIDLNSKQENVAGGRMI